MEHVIGQRDCGCKIIQEGDVWVRIEYCPKHKAAPDMYKALKAAHRELLHAQWEDGLDIIEQALALADGGK